MQTLPTTGLFVQVGPRPTVDTFTGGVEDVAQWAREQISAPDPDTPATISGGTLTLTQSYHAVEGEGAASDDLAAISTAGVPDGTVALLRAFNATHVITAKHATSGSGHIELAGAADFALNDATMWLMLKLRGDAWYEIDRSYGSNASDFRTFWGLKPGTDVQAYSALLAALAGVSAPGANKLAYLTGAASWALTALTSIGRSIIGAADDNAVKALLPKALIYANKNGSDQTGIANSTDTKVTFTNELVDTDGFYDAVNSKIAPNRACTLAIFVTLQFTNANMSNSTIGASIVRNGTDRLYGPTFSGLSGSGGTSMLRVITFNGTTDYAEIGTFVSGGTTGKTVSGNSTTSFFAWEI
jgi:hypothetical protein